MIRFAAHRLLQSLLLLAVMSFAIYCLIGPMPGDPVDVMIASDPTVTAEDTRRLREIYGLDQPLVDRYLAWAGSALQGDLGYSRLFGQPVMDVVLPRTVNTLLLLGISLALALAVALPLGIAAAHHPRSAADTVINLFCFAGISVPPFWLALLAIMLFAVTLGWLPAGGTGPVGADGPVDRLPYLVLPVATLTMATVGGYTRYVRSAMIEAMRQDWVRTARAKGVPEWHVVWGHALRNALLPVVTIIGLDIGTLFSGALVIETMFAWLGMGKLIYDAVLGNDYNVVLVGLLLATAMTLLGNLLADVAYAGLDPRISFAGART